MNYKRPWLDEKGAKFLFALILDKLDELDEPFVTYGKVAELLERKLGIPKIFPLHIGSVAGNMMDEILSVADDAPPINGLVANDSGIPGKGFAFHYDKLWRKRGGKQWPDLTQERKAKVVQEVREAVRRYDKWDEVFRQAFGDRPENLDEKKYTERDGKPPDASLSRGQSESDEHRRLKEWARDNPRLLGLSTGFLGETEKGMLSGDRLDVFFTNGTDFAVVEVKSILSSDDDLQRGLYQCVKYRAIVMATELPVQPNVRAILITERQIPPELQKRAKMFDIKVRVKKLNCR